MEREIDVVLGSGVFQARLLGRFDFQAPVPGPIMGRFWAVQGCPA